MVRLLTKEEVDKLQPIFEKEFDADIPPTSQANVVGVFENDQLQGFIVCELMFRVGMVSIRTDKRNTSKSVKYLRALFRYLHQSIPRPSTVITVLDDDKYVETVKRNGIDRKSVV